MINSGLEIRRYIIKVFGIVQGVGFRPFIYNLAKSFDLRGWVKNGGSHVIIDVEGEKKNIKVFILNVVNKSPSLARIDKVKISIEEWIGYQNFSIIKSRDEAGVRLISADIATCSKCISEIFDSESRYYRYPFNNCTECGPRYTIIEKLPYDRENTTMKNFPMCKICKEEYEDPISRRFHAQPTCCGDCGPFLWLTDNLGNKIVCEDPIVQTAKLLNEGNIVAIKGIGGFHLACDATNSDVVRQLRMRKNRPHKPLAIMAKDIDSIRKICILSPKEESIVLDNKRPIVLLDKKEDLLLPNDISPGLKKIGVMLPYTATHHLLFHEDINFLVMTSGNINGSPIEYKNYEAMIHLKDIADYFLFHNRDINNPVDDSVVKVVNDVEMVVRQGRGYSPYGIYRDTKEGILALGVEEKGSFSLSQNEYLTLGQYIGDIKNYDTYISYLSAINHLKKLLKVNTRVFVYDLHPAYISTQYGSSQEGNKVSVQHHHAHMVSCMAEHDIHGEVIGIIYDGTGLGDDGALWGGEFFVGSVKSYKRVAHLKYVEIQGGDKAIIEPWRTAISYLYSIGENIDELFTDVGDTEIKLVREALSREFNCYKTSSMGRLFDCVAALVGFKRRITYDGQAAIELEAIADESVHEYYRYSILDEKEKLEMDYKDMIKSVIEDILKGIAPQIISGKFHNTISKMTIDMAEKIRKIHDISTVVLSGGVFENNILLKSVYEGLKTLGFKVFYNNMIPINDNGISVGQLMVADQKLRE